MELLLLRFDAFRDRKRYVETLREWLREIGISSGRLITCGEVHLLFIAAESDKNAKLLEFFASRAIDTNSRDELCVDRFIDELGRKQVDKSACKGFLEMNILNEAMLRKLLVEDWQVEAEWIDTALATPRSKAFLAWRDAAKAARRDRRKRSAQERDHQREAKKLKQETAPEDNKEAAATEKPTEAESESDSHKIKTKANNEDEGEDEDEKAQAADFSAKRKKRNNRNKKKKKSVEPHQ